MIRYFMVVSGLLAVFLLWNSHVENRVALMVMGIIFAAAGLSDIWRESWSGRWRRFLRKRE